MSDENEQLIKACRHNNLSEARRLLSTGRVDANYKDDYGVTSLMWPCEEGHLDIARMLLQEFRADVNLKDNDGGTALMFACQFGHLDIARMLLQEFRADVNLTNNKGKTAMTFCDESCAAELETIIAELRSSLIPVPQPASSAAVIPPPLVNVSAMNSNPALDSSGASRSANQQSIMDDRFATMKAERDSLEEELSRLQTQLDVVSEAQNRLQTQLHVVVQERNNALIQVCVSNEERDRAVEDRNNALTQVRVVSEERDRAVEELNRIRTEYNSRLRDDLPPFRLDKRYLLRHPCTGIAGTLHRCMDGSPLFEYAQRLCRTGGLMTPRQLGVHEFRLVAVDEVVHFPRQVAAFEARLETLEELRGTGGSHFNFATNQFVPEKLAVLTALRDTFHERAAGEPPRRVNTLYCFHGPRREHVESICRNGLVDVRAMDAGYFGSGCYSTLNIEYAVRYAFGDFDQAGQRRAPSEDGRYPIVMFAAAVGMAYPITPAEDYGNVEGVPDRHSDYFGRPLRPGFDLHCVCVSECAGMQAVTRDRCQYMELVMSQQSDLLPIAVLWFDRLL